MTKAFPVVLLAVLTLAGCSNPSSPSASPTNAGTPAIAGDPVEKKLQEFAGGGATNCGRLKSQAAGELDAAAKCATQSAQKKSPFYVAYELPGMIIAVAGNSDGKFFTVQSGSGEMGGAVGLASGKCPSELRVAPSGRVTCFAPGTFGLGIDAAHGGMTMPPPIGENPHKRAGNPPPGQANPQ